VVIATICQVVDGAQVPFNALMLLYPLASFNTVAQIVDLIVIAILAKMKDVFGAKMENAETLLTPPGALLNTLAILIAKDTQIALLVI
jgi:hypothetical protein